MQQDSNLRPFSSEMSNQSFSKTSQMIKLCCEKLIGTVDLTVCSYHSRACFRVNPHSIIWTVWLNGSVFV